MTTISAEALFREHAPFVASFLARLGAPPPDLDDLVQEVFLVVHRSGGYAPAAARPTTWLAEIAMRILRNARRTRRRWRVDADAGAVDAAMEDGAGPHEAVESAQELALVQLALDDLDLDLCALFVLHELEEESCRSIAAGLRIPVGTVHSRLHTARQAFLKAYKRHVAQADFPLKRRGAS